MQRLSFFLPIHLILFNGQPADDLLDVCHDVVGEFGRASSAFIFSRTCSTRLAPVMTVLTFGFFKHQAIAICARVTPRSEATICSFLTFSIASWSVNLSRSHSKPFSEPRDPVGMPLLYFPVSKPEASGLYIVEP